MNLRSTADVLLRCREMSQTLKPKRQGEFCQAVLNYLTGVAPGKLHKDVFRLFTAIQPALDACKNRGGAPIGNQNAKKQPKTTENNQKQPLFHTSFSPPTPSLYHLDEKENLEESINGGARAQEREFLRACNEDAEFIMRTLPGTLRLELYRYACIAAYGTEEFVDNLLAEFKKIIKAGADICLPDIEVPYRKAVELIKNISKDDFTVLAEAFHKSKITNPAHYIVKSLLNRQEVTV